ncbi:unnamed protein product [Adineta steineri]|uniref:Radical SAM core domain-containing protein n=1 Tax=Adineta steineri TaxID=433720 RepID=A0A820D2V2_9BILA|nr:unnamed protein product [Adineta steineri]CAF4224921.1 unnamed protein product [Adineta steineri]
MFLFGDMVKQQIQDRCPQIQGIYYAGQIDKNQSAKTNFNELPPSFLNNLIPNQNFVRWETQRGCPFSCSFCQHRKIALQTRIEIIKPEFLDLIVQLNKTAMVVLEFGLQTIHPSEQKFIGRPSNMKKIQRILNEIYERSIECEVSLIFGLPGQTIDSFEKSIDVVTWNTFI